MTNKLALAASVLVLSTGCSPMYLAARPPVDISEYRGDGTIARLSNPINPGFKIEFPSFSLDQQYSATLQLTGLPKPRHHSPYEVGLVVDLSVDESARWPEVASWLKKRAMGTVVLSVATESGESLLNLEVPVAGLYWSRRTEEPQVFAVLRRNDSAHAEAAVLSSSVELERLPRVLQISYTPGPDSIARSARVRLVGGGED